MRKLYDKIISYLTENGMNLVVVLFIVATIGILFKAGIWTWLFSIIVGFVYQIVKGLVYTALSKKPVFNFKVMLYYVIFGVIITLYFLRW